MNHAPKKTLVRDEARARGRAPQTTRPESGQAECLLLTLNLEIDSHLSETQDNQVYHNNNNIIIILIIKISTEEGLSHSKMLFMRVLYLTNCSNSLKTLYLHKNPDSKRTVLS